MLTLANSGLPYPLKSTAEACLPIELPGIPLGTFPGVDYDQLSLEIATGDVFVFCTDGIYETFNAAEEEFGTERVAETVQTHRGESAQLIAASIFDAVDGFRGEAPQGDDMTVVVVKITA